MRLITMLFFLVWICVADVIAQTKSAKQFSFPAQMATTDYQLGRVLVKIKSRYKNSFQGGMRSNGRTASVLPGKMRSLSTGRGRTNSSVDISLYYEISFDPTIPVDEFINDLYKTDYIEIAEPVYRQRMMVTPNDPSIGSQYYLTKIRAPEAWDITQGDENMIIAIVDSGVDIDHPDLAGKMYINT